MRGSCLFLLLALGRADELADELRRSRQQCEMCGILVMQLEDLGASLHSKFALKREEHEKATKKRGVLGRTSRAEMPARIIDAFEEYLEISACGGSPEPGLRNVDGSMPSPDQMRNRVSAIARQVCRADGIAESLLRLPMGNSARFNVEHCTQRVAAVCEDVRRDYADELIEAAYSNLTASACEEIIEDGCDTERAKLLLGPMYGQQGRGPGAPKRVGSVGVPDVWKKMPGRPAYYLNMARHLSQVEPPPGWDPTGPNEQRLLMPKEEL